MDIVTATTATTSEVRSSVRAVGRHASTVTPLFTSLTNEDKMKSVIALAWIAILTCSLVDNRFLRESVSDNRLGDLVHEIVRSSYTRDVFILIRNHRNDDVAAQIISVVSETALKLLPTMIIDVTKTSKSPDDLATSASLLIYVYASRVDVQSWDEIVSNLLEVSSGSHTPRILFLLVVDETDTHIEDFYKYLWTQKIIRVEILEVLSSTKLMVAHRYNPFSNSYTKEDPFSVTWYPDKVENMHRQPICYQSTEQYNTTSSHSVSELYFRSTVINALSFTMNFSLFICDDVSEAEAYHPQYSYLSKLDDTANYIEMFLNSDVCLITPILPVKTVFLWNIFYTICLGAAIVIVFLVASIFLRIDERLRRAMYLVNLLLGFSVTLLPTTSREKVVFLSLVTVSIMYTTMFYTEIFELSFVHQEYQIDDFEDLARSGLTVMVDEPTYPEFMNSEHIPRSVKRNMLPWMITYGDEILDLQPRANTSYFFEREVAEMIVNSRQDAFGQRLFKLNNLCVEVRSVLLTMKKRSPYKERFQNIAIRMMTAGFLDRAEKIISTVFTLAQTNAKHRAVVERKFEIPFPVVILLCGLFLSTLVFFGELILSKCSRNTT